MCIYTYAFMVFRDDFHMFLHLYIYTYVFILFFLTVSQTVQALIRRWVVQQGQGCDTTANCSVCAKKTYDRSATNVN